jgi:hypothetical protein
MHGTGLVFWLFQFDPFRWCMTAGKQSPLILFQRKVYVRVYPIEMLLGLPFENCQSLIVRPAHEKNLSKTKVAAFPTEIWPEHPSKSLPKFERSQIVGFTTVKS